MSVDMGIFDFLNIKTAQKSVFSFFIDTAYPGRKEDEHLEAYYTSWVYACVNAIADEVASMRVHLNKSKTNGDIEEADDQPAMKLLRHVNPFTSSSDLLYATAGFLKLNGNAFWYMVRNGSGEPTEIWTLRPDRMEVKKSENRYVAGYEYRNAKGSKVPFDVDEIIHFKKFNPLDPYRGVGTIKAAALAVDTDTSAASWNYNQFRNSAVPSGLLTTEQVLSKSVFERIRDQWQRNYGGVKNAKKVAVLEAGLDFKKVSLTPEEMDFLKQREYSRDEIMAMFRVPKTVLGITDDVNRANAEATDYVFAKRVVEPEIRFIIDKLNEFYLPMFGLDQDEYFFDYDDPVPENTELDIKRRESGLKYGYYTINEVRAEDGLEPVEWGDEPILDSKMWPLEDLGYKEPVPFGDNQDQEDDEQDEEGKAVYKAGGKTVQKRIHFLNSKIEEAKGRFKDIYLQQRDDLIRQLTGQKALKKDRADSLVSLLFENWDSWIGLLVDASRDTMFDTLAEGGRTAVAQIGGGITFDLLNPRVLDWLDENALQHAKSVNATIKDEVTLILMEGVEQGLGTNEIAENIRGFFDEQSDWRALRVARTEVMTGYGRGTYEGYRQSGVVTGKRWLTAGDASVCEICRGNEQQGVVPLEENFKSGDLTPVSHPNCRCVIQPVV